MLRPAQTGFSPVLIECAFFLLLLRAGSGLSEPVFPVSLWEEAYAADLTAALKKVG
jgi:hypothetical protein